MSLEKKRRDVDESNPLVDNTSRENSAAFQLKAVVIEGEDNDKPHDGSGYYLAWAPKLMLKLDMPQEHCFTKGMSGGISGIIGNLRFIPKAGRKKKQTKEKGRPGS
ncbi:hypothetical protein PSENEW3n2_00000901 [Picochlorum sp. SENEW3]|nr:hypothetical protein PSENEW3n2_00000901 [Picochlorum sp. SENEW3]WPT14957.1 hypothetical protein PSENEW3_00000901 [Picochlorum sp. SENEW3]